MAEINLSTGNTITVEETYEDVSIEIYESKMDKYPFIRLSIKEKEGFVENQRLIFRDIDKEIQININQIVWFK